MWEIPIQSPVSITKSQGSIRLQCHFKDFSGNFDKTAIHWYQQKENKTLARMIYITSGASVVDESFQRHRYMIQTISRQKLCILTVRRVLLDDAATYHCTYWAPHYGRSQTITPTNTPPAAQPQTTWKIPTHFPSVGESPEHMGGISPLLTRSLHMSAGKRKGFQASKRRGWSKQWKSEI